MVYVIVRTASSACVREQCEECDSVGEERLTSWKVTFSRIAALVAGSGAAGCSLTLITDASISSNLFAYGGRRASDVGISVYAYVEGMRVFVLILGLGTGLNNERKNAIYLFFILR